MVRIKIRFCYLLMASPALLHDFKLETLLIRPPDRMSRMAIVAHRQLFSGG